METDLSEYHKGTDGLYYADYIAPNKAETFIGKLVSTEWWHHRGQFALICNFRTEDRRRIALFAFQKHTGFYGPRYGNVNFKTVEKGTLWPINPACLKYCKHLSIGSGQCLHIFQCLWRICFCCNGPEWII